MNKVLTQAKVRRKRSLRRVSLRTLWDSFSQPKKNKHRTPQTKMISKAPKLFQII